MVPIKEPHVSFCREFQSRLTALGMRSDLDDRNESMGLKTREAQMAKIPFTLVAGDREMAAGQFAVRKYGERESKVLSLEEIIREFSDLQAVPKKLK
ncbi:MAG: His/Gly/Thr/Pro-type tRNA ligase C-terminal domain-containing protein [Bdellovibrionota bacterium]